jgi:hypothetical protein
MRPAVAALILVPACLLAAPARSAQLTVGPGQTLRTPAEAAAAAQDGDTVSISPGSYFDCAIWTADNLTIEGSGPGVVLTDKPCEGKASFVIRGSGITIRNLTFTRIRVPDRNGAGIRVEGGSVTIEHSRFVDDQIGVLVSDTPPDRPAGTIVVRDCAFSGNGLPDRSDGTADLLVGRVALLRVEGSRFGEGRGGAEITSAALRTELVGDRIDGGDAMPPAYLVGALAGGSLVMEDTVLTLRAKGLPRIAAIAVARDGGLPPGTLALRRIELVNQTAVSAVLLRNWTGVTPELVGNVVGQGDVEASDSGALLHRVKHLAHQTIAWLRATAGQTRHVTATALRGLRLL